MKVLRKAIVIFTLVFCVTGCQAAEPKQEKMEESGTQTAIEEPDPAEAVSENQAESLSFEKPADKVSESVKNVDLNKYFEGINGCAVFYNPAIAEYKIYNVELSEKQSSPCSTFKIVSSLLGLEHKVIDPDNSVFEWNGTEYWKSDWNRDIGFQDAFKASCIWYYREVINRLGQNIVQEGLDQLNYGNCDISDWEGRLNTNNNNRDLTGFWVESSLIISPKEQTRVLSNIFEESAKYEKNNIALLKQVMEVEREGTAGESGQYGGIKIYGKTGMGVKEGKTVDAWFVGMFEKSGETVYFAVRLDDPENDIVSSQKAKEILLNIVDWESEGLIG